MARNGAGTERFTAVDSACGPQCTLPVRWTGGRRGVALGAALALPRKFPRQRRVDHMALLDLVSAQEGLFFGGWIRGPARKAFTLSEDERLRAANHMAVFAAFIDEKDERGGRSSLKRINRGRRKGYLLRCKQALRSGTLSRWAGEVQGVGARCYSVIKRGAARGPRAGGSLAVGDVQDWAASRG